MAVRLTRGRAVRRSALTVGLGVALLMTGCAPTEQPDPNSASGTARSQAPAVTPTRILTSAQPFDYAVAAALAEHLNAVHEDAEPLEVVVTADPWQTLPGPDQADTLVVANSVDVPVPESVSDPQPAESESSRPESPLAQVSTANDTAVLVEEFLAGQDLAESTAQVIGSSAAVLRINPVTTRVTAAEYELTLVEDLDQESCEDMTFTPGVLPARLVEPVQTELAQRYDCVGDWAESVSATAPEALNFFYGLDPDITDRGLAVLEDEQQLLPEGRILVLGQQEALTEEALVAIEQVLAVADEERIGELVRMVEQARSVPEDSGLELDAAGAAAWWLEFVADLQP